MGKTKLDSSEAARAARHGRLAAEWEHRKQFEAVIAAAAYDPAQKRLVITLNNGLGLLLDPAHCQELAELDEAELMAVQVSPAGSHVYWDESGAGIPLDNILAGRFGSRKWMEQMQAEHGIPLGLWKDSELARSEWGRMGGSLTSEAKARSSRENGKKGGRPPKQTLSKDAAS